jgi:hypothetical protein
MTTRGSRSALELGWELSTVSIALQHDSPPRGLPGRIALREPLLVVTGRLLPLPDEQNVWPCAVVLVMKKADFLYV